MIYSPRVEGREKYSHRHTFVIKKYKKLSRFSKILKNEIKQEVNISVVGNRMMDIKSKWEKKEKKRQFVENVNVIEKNKQICVSFSTYSDVFIVDGRS